MAAETLAIIARPDLTYLPFRGPAEITDCKQLASYTWWDLPDATISVPGSPPRWSPPPESTVALKCDSGEIYLDQNAAQSPSSPLEPLFRSLFILNPDFSLSDVDLITDSHNLCRLLRFVLGLSLKPFTIRVEIAGHAEEQKGTVLFTRVEPKNVYVIEEGSERYSIEFRKKYTTRLSDSMNGYQKVVGYTFGGLKCIVRAETDAYVPGEEGAGAWSPSDSKETTATGLTILRSKTNQADADVLSALDIKTRTARRSHKIKYFYPQLWFSQTTKLALGIHRDGIFKFRVRDMKNTLSGWEVANRRSFEELAGLLGKIIDVVKASNGGRAVVEYVQGEDLRIVADNGGQPALPEDLYAKWTNEQPQPDEARDEDDKGTGSSGQEHGV